MSEMIHYKSYDMTGLRDKYKNTYSKHIAALDVQYSHHAPYIWAFALSAMPDKIAYGRTWEELREFLHSVGVALHLWIKVELTVRDKHKIEDPAGLEELPEELLEEDENEIEQVEGHILKVFVGNLSDFWQFSKSELDYLPLPLIAKQKREILLATLAYGMQVQSYEDYWETEVDKDVAPVAGMRHVKPATAALSARCKLSALEFDYIQNRIDLILNRMKSELDTAYNSDPKLLVLTMTAKVIHMINEQLRADKNEDPTSIENMIRNINPLCSDEGLECLLPKLQRAFTGGVTFYERGVINQIFNDVWSADLTSAYVARIFLSRFPISKFKPLDEQRLAALQRSKSPSQKLLSKEYENSAMLITFECTGLKLKPEGWAFISCEEKNRYRHFRDGIQEDYENEVYTNSSKIYYAPRYSSTITDIDFRLLHDNYTYETIKIKDVYAARYGYLPDYISNVIAKLYMDKVAAKDEYKLAERLGAGSLQAEYEYERIKSIIARLYGIFTQRPVLIKYGYVPELHDTIILNPRYIGKSKYKPVVYQWGVWTTAWTRKEIADLRSRLLSAPEDRQIRVISGDTDCINFTGDATDIIADYNAEVNRQIRLRAAALGFSAEHFRDLGNLEVKLYKKYKICGLKQYAYIKETEHGDQFDCRVGGMSRECSYFQDVCKGNLNMAMHLFCPGTTIPAEYAPRVCNICIDEPRDEIWTDRDGNKIQERVKSFREIDISGYVIHDPYNLKLQKRAETRADELRDTLCELRTTRI